MPLNPPQAYRKVEFIHRKGLAAAKPAASDVLIGTLYFSTDTGTLERSNGLIWETYAGSGGGGTGDVVGPAGATDNAVALYDGVTGKLIKNSTLTPSNIQTKPILVADLPAHHLTHEPGGSDPLTVDALAAVGSLRTLGVGANQAAPGNDARFTAPPVAHHVSHETGGSDAITALSGGVITTGTVADARLSANVALKNIDNAFSVAQTLPTQSWIYGPNSWLNFWDTLAPVDAKYWRIVSYSNGVLRIQALSDTGVLQSDTLVLDRGGGVTSAGSLRAGTDIYEKGRGVPLGHWAPIAYNPADFTADSGATWTVDGGDFSASYTLIGKTVTIRFVIYTSSISGANPTFLYWNTPFNATSGVHFPIWSYDIAIGWSLVSAYTTGTQIGFLKSPGGGTWSITTNSNYLIGSFSYEVY